MSCHVNSLISYLNELCETHKPSWQLNSAFASAETAKTTCMDTDEYIFMS